MRKLCIMLILLWLLIPCLCFATDTINENSRAILTLTFKDEAGVAVIPTTFKYRIDDVPSGTEMVSIQTITPSTSIYDLTIVSATNRILNSSKPYEQRRVTVQWYVGATLVGTADYTYKVLNLNRVPFP